MRLKMNIYLHKIYNGFGIYICLESKKKNAKSVYENIADEIKLEWSRYIVKLPFKKDHPVTPENYSLFLKFKKIKRVKELSS